MRREGERKELYGSYNHTHRKTSLTTGSFSASEIDVAVEDPAVSSVTDAGPHLCVPVTCFLKHQLSWGWSHSP